MPFSQAKTSRRDFLAASAGVAVTAALPSSSSAFPPPHTLDGISGSTALPSKPQRIILDTDPGVDDAIAIFLALRSPEFQVEAVTPVSGNVPLSFTLPNALRLLEIAGRPEIPVAAGAAVPLVRRLVTAAYVHGNNGLGGVEFPEPRIKPVAENASDLIRRIVRANPGEITIVAVGPLTNIATVLKADPAIAPMIKSFVLMGGCLAGGNRNIRAARNFEQPESIGKREGERHVARNWSDCLDLKFGGAQGEEDGDGVVHAGVGVQDDALRFGRNRRQAAGTEQRRRNRGESRGGKRGGGDAQKIPAIADKRMRAH